MTRWALAPIALLLACAPPTDGGRNAEPGGVEPAAESPSNEPARRPAAPAPKQSLQAGGSYYQYVDESGRVRFAASLEDVPERQRSTAGRVSLPSAPPRRSAPRRQAEQAREEDSARNPNVEVVLYTTESCGYCRKAIAYLDRIGQDYVNKNVEIDDEARNEYLELTNGRSGVPVILVGDKWIQGWNQREVEQMLAAAD